MADTRRAETGTHRISFLGFAHLVCCRPVHISQSPSASFPLRHAFGRALAEKSLE